MVQNPSPVIQGARLHVGESIYRSVLGHQGFIELKSPYVDHRVEYPGNCRVALEVGDHVAYCPSRLRTSI